MAARHSRRAAALAAMMRFPSRERGAVVRQNDGQSERSKRRASTCGRISVAKFARRCGDGSRVRNAVTGRFQSAGCSSFVMTARSRDAGAPLRSRLRIRFVAALMRFPSRERGAVVRQNDGQSERSKRRASACGQISVAKFARRCGDGSRVRNAVTARFRSAGCDSSCVTARSRGAGAPLRSRLRIRFVAAPMRFQSRERGAVVRQNDGQSERSKRRASACGRISVAKFVRRCGDGSRVRNAVTARFRSAGCSSPVMTARSRGAGAPLRSRLRIRERNNNALSAPCAARRATA